MTAFVQIRISVSWAFSNGYYIDIDWSLHVLTNIDDPLENYNAVKYSTGVNDPETSYYTPIQTTTGYLKVYPYSIPGNTAYNVSIAPTTTAYPTPLSTHSPTVTRSPSAAAEIGDTARTAYVIQSLPFTFRSALNGYEDIDVYSFPMTAFSRIIISVSWADFDTDINWSLHVIGSIDDPLNFRTVVYSSTGSTDPEIGFYIPRHTVFGYLKIYAHSIVGLNTEYNVSIVHPQTSNPTPVSTQSPSTSLSPTSNPTAERILLPTPGSSLSPSITASPSTVPDVGNTARTAYLVRYIPFSFRSVIDGDSDVDVYAFPMTANVRLRISVSWDTRESNETNIDWTLHVISRINDTLSDMNTVHFSTSTSDPEDGAYTPITTTTGYLKIYPSSVPGPTGYTVSISLYRLNFPSTSPATLSPLTPSPSTSSPLLETAPSPPVERGSSGSNESLPNYAFALMAIMGAGIIALSGVIWCLWRARNSPGFRRHTDEETGNDAKDQNQGAPNETDTSKGLGALGQRMPFTKRG